jgi:hypothetical protein
VRCLTCLLLQPAPVLLVPGVCRLSFLLSIQRSAFSFSRLLLVISLRPSTKSCSFQPAPVPGHVQFCFILVPSVSFRLRHMSFDLSACQPAPISISLGASIALPCLFLSSLFLLLCDLSLNFLTISRGHHFDLNLRYSEVCSTFFPQSDDIILFCAEIL